MEIRYIRLKGIKDVLEFTQTAKQIPCTLSLQSGRYSVDAKSNKGIFSINLLQEIKLEIHSNEKDVIKLADELLNNYITKKE